MAVRTRVLAVGGDPERQHGRHDPPRPFFPKHRSTHPLRRFAPATYSRSFVARAVARLYARASATRARPPRTCTREALCEVDRLDISRPHISHLTHELSCEQEERYRCARGAPRIRYRSYARPFAPLALKGEAARNGSVARRCAWQNASRDREVCEVDTGRIPRRSDTSSASRCHPSAPPPSSSASARTNWRPSRNARTDAASRLLASFAKPHSA